LLAGQSGRLQNNPFTFIGAYGVMDEYGGLYYMKNRYYDASTGRFIQKDPLGTTASLNLYGYVGDNPLNRIDPLGLFDRGFLSPAETKKALSSGGDLAPFIGAVSGPVTASTNLAIGVYGAYSAITGIVSGGSIPLATFLLTVAGSRIYSTVKRAINGEYGADYQPGDAPVDLIDPTKGMRAGKSWLGQKWDDFNHWGTQKMDETNNFINSCYGAPR
jgi:RHS repeat-associated protein